ncbi:MAG TPA: nucleoside triphosphate pyrophosphohydrolase [Terriglobales bacterium]|nr:nucleoside triphosphate pyrophosphohydrolase [Terriglobales bacterium]
MAAPEEFAELVRIMARLRAPGGCPWDREQTHASIKPYVIEEAYEVAEAIDDGDFGELRKELGDLLLQVVFHAQMASEAGQFTIEDVVRAINDKMVRRHPHVFAGVDVSGSDEVLRNWAKIKTEERQGQADNSVVTGVPRALPALLRAHRLGEKASHVHFDWQDAAAVLDKVDEELGELRQALAAESSARVAAELGDLLHALASLGRHLGIHAEDALQGANDRFIRRFHAMEEGIAMRGKDIHDLTADELELIWSEVKAAEG